MRPENGCSVYKKQRLGMAQDNSENDLSERTLVTPSQSHSRLLLSIRQREFSRLHRDQARPFHKIAIGIASELTRGRRPCGCCFILKVGLSRRMRIPLLKFSSDYRGFLAPSFMLIETPSTLMAFAIATFALKLFYFNFRRLLQMPLTSCHC